MTSHELKERTMDFAVRVLKMVDALPKTTTGRTVGGQIARSGTSVAANYRAALRAKSDADFINKITIVLEEADESGFWIELAERAELLPPKRLKGLLQESEELTKIFNATRSTTKRRARQNRKS
ncbi:four helix bundle protein [Prosthecobacter vanneervenii]|uniref:Four helix bundle protein n=1 Tax=Prosthecobacter vanneervenii TaxID=48466 RepID=A0A7W7Y781_9BACT|nr:four helix bundle protein [Prosthecobacter vanneervenii]MBB5030901.1 four helix bundle protein [Prosthecobacter vanneervenii]